MLTPGGHKLQFTSIIVSAVMTSVFRLAGIFLNIYRLLWSEVLLGGLNLETNYHNWPSELPGVVIVFILLMMGQYPDSLNKANKNSTDMTYRTEKKKKKKRHIYK